MRVAGRELFRRLLLSTKLSRDAQVEADLDGRRHVVLNSHIGSDGQVHVEVFDGTEVRLVPLYEYIGEIRWVEENLDPAIYPDPEAELLHWLTPTERREALRLQAHLRDILDGRPSCDTSPGASTYDAETTTPEQRRAAKMKELGFHKSKMSRRLTAYDRRGLPGLIAHSSRKTNLRVVIQVPGEILAVVRQTFDDLHWGGKRDLKNQYAIIIDELRRRGLVTTAPEPIVGADGAVIPTLAEVLTYDQFRDLFNQLNRTPAGSTAKTRHEQAHRPLDGGLRHRTEDFATLIHVDATTCDFKVRGPDGQPKSVYAVFAICVATRVSWIRLCEEPPRGKDLALLLFDIFGGSSLALAQKYERLPGIPHRLSVNAMPPNSGPPLTGVMPGAIRLDHGAEEENQHWISVCAQLNIALLWAGTRTPTHKPYVESLIRTFARDCQLVPSHKGNTTVNKPRSISPESMPTFEHAVRMFSGWHAWALNQPHSGLQVGMTNRYLTPLQAMHASMRRGLPIRHLADPTFHLRLLPTITLQPHDDGVTWQRRRYWCEDYAFVHHTARNRFRTRKLVFFYDPQAKHRLYWIEPETFTVRELLCPQSATGIAPSFATIRRGIDEGLEGAPWPTKTEEGASRSELLALMRNAWEGDGLDPKLEYPRIAATGPVRSTPAPKKGRKSRTSREVSNDGWRLEDFVDPKEDEPNDPWSDINDEADPSRRA